VHDASVPRLGLTDTHAHLSYVSERLGQRAIDDLAAAYGGSGAIVLDPGVDYDDYPGRKAAFGGLGFVRLAAGIWPDAESIVDLAARVASLEESVRDPGCVAVGECGLDYHWMHGSEAAQAALFSAQIELAVRYGKPLIVHSRDAHRDTLAIVKPAASRIPVVIHCFGYDEAAALEYVAAGCYVSFAGNLSYKKSGALRAACAAVPAGRLLLETDSPYMCPEPRRGKDATPLDIGRTYALAAELRGVGLDALADTIARNASILFG